MFAALNVAQHGKAAANQARRKLKIAHVFGAARLLLGEDDAYRNAPARGHVDGRGNKVLGVIEIRDSSQRSTKTRMAGHEFGRTSELSSVRGERGSRGLCGMPPGFVAVGQGSVLRMR